MSSNYRKEEKLNPNTNPTSSPNSSSIPIRQLGVEFEFGFELGFDTKTAPKGSSATKRGRQFFGDGSRLRLFAKVLSTKLKTPAEQNLLP